MSTSRNHQGGKNPKQRSLPAAIRPQQSKQLRRPNIERNPIQSGAIPIAMDDILNGNNGGCGGRCHFRFGVSECGDFSNQGGPGTTPQVFYADTVLSIIRVNNSGR